MVKTRVITLVRERREALANPQDTANPYAFPPAHDEPLKWVPNPTFKFLKTEKNVYHKDFAQAMDNRRLPNRRNTNANGRNSILHTLEWSEDLLEDTMNQFKMAAISQPAQSGKCTVRNNDREASGEKRTATTRKHKIDHQAKEKPGKMPKLSNTQDGQFKNKVEESGALKVCKVNKKSLADKINIMRHSLAKNTKSPSSTNFNQTPLFTSRKETIPKSSNKSGTNMIVIESIQSTELKDGNTVIDVDQNNNAMMDKNNNPVKSKGAKNKKRKLFSQTSDNDISPPVVIRKHKGKVGRIQMQTTSKRNLDMTEETDDTTIYSNNTEARFDKSGTCDETIERAKYTETNNVEPRTPTVKTTPTQQETSIHYEISEEIETTNGYEEENKKGKKATCTDQTEFKDEDLLEIQTQLVMDNVDNELAEYCLTIQNETDMEKAIVTPDEANMNDESINAIATLDNSIINIHEQIKSKENLEKIHPSNACTTRIETDVSIDNLEFANISLIEKSEHFQQQTLSRQNEEQTDDTHVEFFPTTRDIDISSPTINEVEAEIYSQTNYSIKETGIADKANGYTELTREVIDKGNRNDDIAKENKYHERVNYEDKSLLESKVIQYNSDTEDENEKFLCNKSHSNNKIENDVSQDNISEASQNNISKVLQGNVSDYSNFDIAEFDDEQAKEVEKTLRRLMNISKNKTQGSEENTHTDPVCKRMEKSPNLFFEKSDSRSTLTSNPSQDFNVNKQDLRYRNTELLSTEEINEPMVVETTSEVSSQINVDTLQEQQLRDSQKMSQTAALRKMLMELTMNQTRSDGTIPEEMDEDISGIERSESNSNETTKKNNYQSILSKVKDTEGSEDVDDDDVRTLSRGTWKKLQIELHKDQNINQDFFTAGTPPLYDRSYKINKITESPNESSKTELTKKFDAFEQDSLDIETVSQEPKARPQKLTIQQTIAESFRTPLLDTSESLNHAKSFNTNKTKTNPQHVEIFMTKHRRHNKPSTLGGVTKPSTSGEKKGAQTSFAENAKKLMLAHSIPMTESEKEKMFKALEEIAFISPPSDMTNNEVEKKPSSTSDEEIYCGQQVSSDTSASKDKPAQLNTEQFKPIPFDSPEDEDQQELENRKLAQSKIAGLLSMFVDIENSSTNETTSHSDILQKLQASQNAKSSEVKLKIAEILEPDVEYTSTTNSDESYKKLLVHDDTEFSDSDMPSSISFHDDTLSYDSVDTFWKRTPNRNVSKQASPLSCRSPSNNISPRTNFGSSSQGHRMLKLKKIRYSDESDTTNSLGKQEQRKPSNFQQSETHSQRNVTGGRVGTKKH